MSRPSSTRESHLPCGTLVVRIKFDLSGAITSITLKVFCEVYCILINPALLKGLIFVVDSNDRERIEKSKEELMKMLNEDELRDAVLLVFANKQDLPNAMSPAEIVEKLSLSSIGNRKWHVEATCATTGEGLYEGLGWLADTLQKRG